MILPIYLYGSEVLRVKAVDADLNQKEYLKELISNMKETMVNADGCGLAAPQIGLSLRVLIVDGRELSDTYEELTDFHRVMINPLVLEEGQETCSYSEGCLSIPGVYGDVIRPKSIKVEYYNEDFEKVVEVFTGFACRMVQHEISHLNGDLFTDRLSPIRRKMIASKLSKIASGKVTAKYKTKLQ